MRLFLPKDSPLINALKCCANCNKDVEPFTLKMCPECRTAHYCNADCQKTHSKNHKHQCNKDAQKLKERLEHNHNKEETANNDDNDDDLFCLIPPNDDCPLCFLPLPINNAMKTYKSCCGNFICKACFIENSRVTLERRLIPCCPFCREPTPTSENEYSIRIKKRIEMNESEATDHLSRHYELGTFGLPKDPQKAFELCLRAAELGSSSACNRAALFYENGIVVAKDMTKARKYYKKAAKKGNIWARHNLGVDEWEKGNYRLACRHYLISAAAGDADSLVEIAKFYKFQLVTKEEYSTALTSYSNVHNDEWSIEREAAAAVAAADETRRQNSSSK